MTNPIQPGDLVLRDGRAEEVSLLSAGFTHYFTHDGGQHRCANAVRIGSTRDGWRIHTGTERPVREDTVVDVAFSGTFISAKPPIKAGGYEADLWTLKGYAGQRIVAYRVVILDITGQGANCGEAVEAQNSLLNKEVATAMEGCFTPYDKLDDRDAEVRKVAAEVREKACVVVSTAQMHAWADRLDPPKPEPLKVGDAVVVASGRDVGDLRFIENGWAVVKTNLHYAWVRSADVKRYEP